jgi:copper chaperone CopZ
VNRRSFKKFPFLYLRFTIYDLRLYNTLQSARSNRSALAARAPKVREIFSDRVVSIRAVCQRIKEAEEVKAEFNVEGMHGDSSALDIKEALEETAGVRGVDVTFQRKTAIVDFDEEVVQQSTLVKKIQDLGYTATIAGQSQSEVGA